MPVVMIYGFTGQYAGNSEYDWNHPERNDVYKCMLFLRQESESPDFENAKSECRRYGFADISDMRVGKLHVEVLNTDLYRGFSGFYEEALAHGGTLVFYPDAARDEGGVNPAH